MPKTSTGPCRRAGAERTCSKSVDGTGTGDSSTRCWRAAKMPSRLTPWGGPAGGSAGAAAGRRRSRRPAARVEIDLRSATTSVRTWRAGCWPRAGAVRKPGGGGVGRRLAEGGCRVPDVEDGAVVGDGGRDRGPTPLRGRGSGWKACGHAAGARRQATGGGAGRHRRAAVTGSILAIDGSRSCASTPRVTGTEVGRLLGRGHRLHHVRPTTPTTPTIPVTSSAPSRGHGHRPLPGPGGEDGRRTGCTSTCTPTRSRRCSALGATGHPG